MKILFLGCLPPTRGKLKFPKPGELCYLTGSQMEWLTYPIVKTWFAVGKDGPKLELIKVRPP